METHDDDGDAGAKLSERDEVAAGGVHDDHDVHCVLGVVEAESDRIVLMRYLLGWAACICLEYPEGLGTDRGQKSDMMLETRFQFGRCCWRWSFLRHTRHIYHQEHS